MRKIRMLEGAPFSVNKYGRSRYNLKLKLTLKNKSEIHGFN